MDRRVVAVLISSLLAAACIVLPVPHQRLPKAQGFLVDRGEPLAGIEVAYVWGRGDCTDPVQTTVTAADGSFSFAGDRTTAVTIAMLPTPPVGWHVCFDKGAYWYGEWAYTVSPAEVHLQCDMRARPVCQVKRIG